MKINMQRGVAEGGPVVVEETVPRRSYEIANGLETDLQP